MERVIDGVRYRIQSEPFNMMDYEAIERHLEEMAAEGWVFSGFGLTGWEYYKSEPQKLRYAVAYLPDSEDYGVLNEKQQELDDYCAKAGWKRVTSSGSAQIYCSKLENPVPIETDPCSRAESLIKTRKKDMGMYVFNFVVWGMMVALKISMYSDNPVMLLSSGETIMMVFVMLFNAVWFGKEAVLYFSWKKKVLRRLENGELLYDADELYKAGDYLQAVPDVLTMGIIMSVDWGYISLILVALMVIAAVISVKTDLKKIISRHWFITPKRKKRLMISYAVMILCIVLSTAWVLTHPDNADTAEDANTKSTFIASSYTGRLYEPDIRFEKYGVKIEALYPYFLEKYIEYSKYGGYKDGEYKAMSESEAALWGVDEVRRLYSKDGRALDKWILIEGSYFTGVTDYDGDLAGDDKTKVSQKLGLSD